MSARQPIHTVIAAMSGGVDSAVAASLLLEQGYAVRGATLLLRPETKGGSGGGSESVSGGIPTSCGSLGDIEDARAVAGRLGIPHDVFDFTGLFQEAVVDKFARVYASGGTPNPCIDCNRWLKFGALLERAAALGADAVATGHYARVEEDPRTGRMLLKKALDPAKDQSYVLYALTQKQLARVLFPLGSLHKAEVRAYAAAHGFENAEKPDSQDICFVPDGDYVRFLEESLGLPNPPGAFLDTQGHPVGTHRGFLHYTVGQRKGLGVTFGEPRFVVSKDAAAGTVTLGKREELFTRTLLAEDVNLIALPELTGPLRVEAKTRYSQAAAPAVLEPSGDSHIRLTFDSPQRAVTPGQAVVFYQDEVVVGGGTISVGQDGRRF